MMNQTLANVAVVLATISTASFLLPQIVKLVKTQDSDGVSTTWPALGFVINVGWFVYLIAQELWASVFAPFFTFLAHAVTMWAVGRTGRNLLTSYLRGAAAAALLTATALLGSWETLGGVPRNLVRRGTGPIDLDGISDFDPVRHFAIDLVDRLGRGPALGLLRMVPLRPRHHHLHGGWGDRERVDVDPVLHHQESFKPSDGDLVVNPEPETLLSLPAITYETSRLRNAY